MLIKRARASRTAEIAREWRELGFTAPPDFARAAGRCDAFAGVLAATGAQWNGPRAAT